MNSEKLINDVLEEIKTFNIDDVPNIDLYMDQVTTYLNGKFSSSKRHKDDKLLTKTMINNYAKSRLLPPPEKKKYSKDHILLLTIIFFLKNVISINDVTTILAPLVKDYYKNKDNSNNLQDLTNAFIDYIKKDNPTESLLEEAINSKHIFEQLESSDKDSLDTIGLIAALSYDIYIRKRLIEQLIDSLPEESEPVKDKNKDKEKIKEKDKNKDNEKDN